MYKPSSAWIPDQWNQWNASNSPQIAQLKAITGRLQGQAVYQPDIIGTGNV